MNPIVLAAAFGFVKGLILNHVYGDAPDSDGSFADGVVIGPISEELQFRLLPFAAMTALGKTPPLGSTALPFGLAHADPRAPLSWNAYRVADAATGGLIYELAFRRHGIFGAVLAHAAHNFFVSLPGSHRKTSMVRRKKR